MRYLVLVTSLIFGLTPLRAEAATDPSAAEIAQIIRKFAARESEFAQARDNYTYRQTVRLLELDAGGKEDGRFEIVSDIIFDPTKKRNEVVVRAPAPTLKRIQMSPEDEQDLRNVLPFVLTSKEVDNYFVRYVGRQKADEIPCYVFAVRPKQMVKGERYFQGLIWVDTDDLQIVKTYGRATGLLAKHSDQQFPKFETYRDQIDGKYWFPVYTIAEDTLQFETGNVPIRATVKYQDYRRFNVDVKITTDEDSFKNAQPSTAPEPGKPADPPKPPVKP